MGLHVTTTAGLPSRVGKSMIRYGTLILAIAFGGMGERAVLSAAVTTRQINASVDHNHCTTRQFQHMTFHHQDVWFVFYSDGRDFRYQTSNDHGETWHLAERPVDQAPNGSTSFDVLKVDDIVYVSHAVYPLGRYDVKAPYGRDPARRSEYVHEGRIKKGRIEGREIRWLSDVNPGFTPDYSNIVRGSAGFLWVITRESQSGVAYRSATPNEIGHWNSGAVCMPVQGRHALDAAALDNEQLYVVSTLTTGGRIYGNLYDGKAWNPEPVLICDEATTVAGDDRRASIEFDPTQKRLHLVYVDGRSKLRYRFLDRPYQAEDWRPALSAQGLELAKHVFTSALSVDTSGSPYGLMITYGIQKHAGRDNRERTGELYTRRFHDERWLGNAILMSRPGTIHNWYPNVNLDVRDGLCMMYSRSVDKTNLGAPLAVMVSVCRPDWNSITELLQN
ncbi:MAG TPA: hypothetical protein ENI81_06940 [Phycisphaerales bacterium]|nr:hypothetical protein [Phycisphaerales bacterium]